VDTLDLFQHLALALAIGLLIGLERGWRERDDRDGLRTAGVRTFTLIGFLGGVSAAITPMLGALPLAAIGLALAAAFTLFYWREMTTREEYSVTSIVVALLAYALGALAVLGDMAVAGAAAVATVAVLAARNPLHEFVKALTWPEVRSGVLLLAMTFVLLPALPNRTIDPWDTFNPHELWLMTVLIAVVCFAGYAGVRILGGRNGLMLSSAVGALISSTTVTLNNSRIAHQKDGKGAGVLAASICIAWVVSVLRMSAIAVAINIAMLRPLAPPILAVALIFGLAALFFQMRERKQEGLDASMFDNPLDLGFVLKFGVLLAAITIAANLANRNLGEGGVLGLAGVSGFADVDPITLSVSRLAGNMMTIANATNAILLAAIANMVTKMSATIVFGGWRFGSPLAGVGLTAIGAGATARFLVGV
jgi:uncharacterized membrane protein (DUF4010 family)